MIPGNNEETKVIRHQAPFAEDSSIQFTPCMQWSLRDSIHGARMEKAAPNPRGHCCMVRLEHSINNLERRLKGDACQGQHRVGGPGPGQGNSYRVWRTWEASLGNWNPKRSLENDRHSDKAREEALTMTIPD